MKNKCAKTRPKDRPYEVWKSFDEKWQWHVLKKWQANDDKPYARWFCLVKSPIMPEGELGDVYVKEIKDNASLIQSNYDEPATNNKPTYDELYRTLHTLLKAEYTHEELQQARSAAAAVVKRVDDAKQNKQTKRDT